MNPLVHWVIAHTVIKSIVRECPRCGHVQMVAKSDEGRAVRCKRCSTSIPAPGADSPGR